MWNRRPAWAQIVVGVWLSIGLGIGSAVYAQTSAKDQSAAEKGAEVTNHAVGTFEVKVTPPSVDDKAEDPTVGRMLLDKQFHGDIDGTSKGEMLTAGTSVKGSGAYVAIERVSGTLKGRKGTFILQHSGTMTSGGSPQLTILVVPDSGTEQLVGLAGTMRIKIADGKHSYDFAYTLPGTP
jgi:Protein of unknown function (DUF3224)